MRSKEITEQYLQLLDQHIEDVSEGVAEEMLPLSAIASLLFISWRHLSDTIRKETGYAPSHFYNLKIIEKAKILLADDRFPVAAIAYRLTYDPSNFSKVFKKVTGITPGDYQRQLRAAMRQEQPAAGTGYDMQKKGALCDPTLYESAL